MYKKKNQVEDSAKVSGGPAAGHIGKEVKAELKKSSVPAGEKERVSHCGAAHPGGLWKGDFLSQKMRGDPREKKCAGQFLLPPASETVRSEQGLLSNSA